MKNFFKFGVAALLAAMLFSCSNLETSETTSINISVPVKSIVEGNSNQSTARTATTNGDDSAYELKIALNVDGKDIVQSAQGTPDELSSKVFTFEDLQVGAEVVASCDIGKDGELIWTGVSETITISEGTNNVVITMKKVQPDEPTVEEHEHAWDEGKVTKEATEEEDGEKTFTCTVCAATKTEVIPAHEHTWTWDGSQYTCSICESARTAFTPSEVSDYLATCAAGSTAKIVVDASADTGDIKNALTSNSSVTVDLVLSGSITSIESSAFYQCTSLVSVTIPEGVETIGNSAFSGCTSLTSVTIPSTVTIIGYEVFYNCSSLTSVTIKSTTPPSVGWDVFKLCNPSAIYVPDVDTYKNDESWEYYADIYKPIP